MRRIAGSATALALAAALAGCGSGPAGATAGPPAAHAPVAVLYAASLDAFVQQRLGPAFERATGDRLDGFPAGSSELASEIRGGVRAGDVFVSASPAADEALRGTSNGAWVRWYAAFARAPLVLAYDPAGRFASALRSRPWEQVVTSPGFLLGRTDPALDPKGILTVQAIRAAAADLHMPDLDAVLGDPATVFPEESLVGRLTSGQLDAAFLYADEARAAGVPSVSLGPSAPGATYTVTVLARAPHRAAADAFVRFLLGPPGRRLLAADGLEVLPRPILTGTGVPAALRPSVTGP